KRYFKIGEVSHIVGVEPHVLRFWEKEFKEIKPLRLSSQRLYRYQDIETILEIKRLLYEEGFTIAGAKKRLAYRLRYRQVFKEVKDGLLEILKILKRF
ncbi:MAG: MerR family transcriptional regulator, partial [Deltaproteobacteria bacterium]|nr:MerR family transcriptional regulator [Deltaproteobacteria bacterium]